MSAYLRVRPAAVPLIVVDPLGTGPEAEPRAVHSRPSEFSPGAPTTVSARPSFVTSTRWVDAEKVSPLSAVPGMPLVFCV